MASNRYIPPMDTHPTLPSFDEAKTDLAKERELGLKPENDKEVHYHEGKADGKTKFSIVFLHGFSASRNELDPYPKNVAEKLGANLYSTRFTGHGTILSSALGEATLKEWQNDALIALRWGLELGHNVILAANSTGATFALWLARHFPDKIVGLILTSPNMGPNNNMSNLLLYPGSNLLNRLFLGKTRNLPATSPKHKLYWHTRYPSKAITTMMQAVETARELPMGIIKVPTIVLYNDKDETVDLEALKDMFQRLGSEKKKLVHIQSASGHLLGGVRSPQSDFDLMEITYNFIRYNMN